VVVVFRFLTSTWLRLTRRLRAVNSPLVVDTPNDPEFLKQFARASVLHAHLDNTLKVFIRSFDETTVEHALQYIGYQGAAKLRAQVTKLAREQFGEGEALTMTLEFMKQQKGS
jgi:hypothetical protein